MHQGPGVGVMGGGSGGIGPGAGLSFPGQTTPVPYSSGYGQHPNGQQPTQMQMGYANAPVQGHVGEASDYYRNQ